MIFPAGWLLRLNDSIREVYDQVFAQDWVHITAHILLFAVLAYNWLQLFSHLQRWAALLSLLAFTLLVGCIQETAQYLTASVYKPLPWEIAFDLFVDLAGSILGAIASAWFLHFRKRELSASSHRPSM